MNYLTQFFTSFCASAIFIGALLIIAPKGKMTKPLKYILTLIFTLTVVGTAVKITPNIDFNFDYTADISENAEVLEVSAAEYVYSECLKKANIDFKKITVCTNKSEDRSIVISKVIIFSNCEKNKILNALYDVAKAYEVEIINE